MVRRRTRAVVEHKPRSLNAIASCGTSVCDLQRVRITLEKVDWLDSPGPKLLLCLSVSEIGSCYANSREAVDFRHVVRLRWACQ